MANILPELNSSVYIEESDKPTLLKEYAWDFNNDEFLFDEQGKFIILEGLEALKVRNYLSLKIYRDRYFIYNKKVGSKLKNIIGKGFDYLNLYIEDYIEEAIVDNVYVTSISDLETEMIGTKAIVTFTVNSIYGSYEENIEVGV